MTAVATHDLVLTGCRPEPLASYLKALGIFRLVAEQKDRDVRGSWHGEHFILRSTLDRDALSRFFLEEWRPTPVIAPWNGGSGFYPKDNHEAPDAILASSDQRLASFARSIEIARSFVAKRGWSERPEKEAKLLAISEMRAQLPDVALAWIDAAVVIGDDRLLFPPLLGTGGNDGRLDFSNNFQQRVMEVLAAHSGASLDASLFGVPTPSRFKGAMGQYLPASNERSNPWDFLLLIEGALVFAASATRRYESGSPAALAFPFHARAAGGLSTVVDADESESRDELWLPLWSSPATFRAIQRLYAEGRATVGSGDQARTAANSLDFARAVTALGVDRGIDAFTRIGFHVRNGLSYFATPLGRFATHEVRAARLLDDIDKWFEKFRPKAVGKNVPARVALARRRLEQAMFDAVESGLVGPVLLELGEAEQALGRSLSFATKAFLDPIPRLPATWATEVVDGSAEQRLAAALATRRGMHTRLVPLDRSGRRFGREDDSVMVFGDQPLVDSLHALLMREDVEAQQSDQQELELLGRPRCTLSDVAQFITGRTDDMLLERWLRALVLVEGGLATELPPEHMLPPATFAILSLVHGRRLGEQDLSRTTGVLARACAGDSVGATGPAIRRLSASGCPMPVAAIAEPVARMRRIAAALAFPLTRNQRRTLESMVLPAPDPSIPNFSEASQEQP
jgi:CRISPR-associated protein Csx17